MPRKAHGSGPAGRGETEGRCLLSFRNVCKTFGKKEKARALHDVSLDVYPGQITGLVGADGAGKTTLLRLAAGLWEPDGGSISILGLDSVSQTHAIRARIGYMPQAFGLYEDLTVKENLDLYADLQGIPGAERKARFVHLLEMTDLQDFTVRRAGKLSGGMKQKLGLACSLIKDPELLLLDEPTVGVDPVSRRDLWEIVYRLVEELGIGVLLATSYLDEAERCARVVVLSEGQKMDEGKPQDFHSRVRGRVFLVQANPEVGPRPLQSVLAQAEGVLDATIRSGKVRCVLQGQEEQLLRDALPTDWVASIQATQPCFEDAFMALWAKKEITWRAQETVTHGDAARPLSSAEPVIRVRGLTKRFGAFIAVQDIQFDVARGEIFGLLGPNGAGKTTTFHMLCGLSQVSDGEVHVAGQDLRRLGPKARARLGYMAQKFSLYRQLTVGSNLRFYGQAYGLSGKRLRDRIDWALSEFDLFERREQNAGDLPGGYRQRLAMATAMLHQPKILFLDEPTSGADPLARREFWLRINGFAQSGVTVVVTTHFMEEAEYCDRMLIMSRGKELAQGSPDEIRSLARTPELPEPTIDQAFVALAEGRALIPVQGGR